MFLQCYEDESGRRVSTLKGRVTGRPRNPAAGGDDGPVSIPPAPRSAAAVEPGRRRGSPQRGALWWLSVILTLGLAATGRAGSEPRPQGPLRWVLRDPARGRAIRENTTAAAPTFTVTLGDLFPQVGGPRSKSLWGTYWCPRSNPGRGHCSHPGYLYCGHWGCETIVTSDRWRPAREDEFLRVKWGPPGCVPPRFASDGMVALRGSCDHLALQVLRPAEAGWAGGRRWSVFIHKAFADVAALVEIVRLAAEAAPEAGPSRAPAP